MRKRTNSIDLAYVTLNGQIPSRTANSVGVMKMCGHFSALGMQTTLIIPDGYSMALEDLGEYQDIFTFYGIKQKFKIKYFPNALANKLSSLPLVYSFFIVLYLYIKKVKFINTRDIEVAFWAAIFKRPVIFESHNYAKIKRHRLLPYWIKYINNPESRVAMTVTTNGGKESYIRDGINAENILVIPNGVDIDLYKTLPEQSKLRKSLGLDFSRKIVGFCGSLYPGRGIDEIIWCAEQLPGLMFVIVGGSPKELEHYCTLAENKNITNIEFIGHVQQKLVPSYLMAADILLMPYTTKTGHSYMSPMKMFDYLATGRPIIATDFPILHEILKDKHNAVMVEPNSGEALTNGIKWVLDNPMKAEEISAQAKKDAASFSWENRTSNVLTWIRGDLGWSI